MDGVELVVEGLLLRLELVTEAFILIELFSNFLAVLDIEIVLFALFADVFEFHDDLLDEANGGSNHFPVHGLLHLPLDFIKVLLAPFKLPLKSEQILYSLLARVLQLRFQLGYLVLKWFDNLSVFF